MGDYSNDVRRGEQPGHDQYFKKIDGIIRQNVRREAVAAPDDNFQIRPKDGVVVINVGVGDGHAFLPPLSQVKQGQEIRVYAVDPLGGGGLLDVTVAPGTADTINEAPAAPIPIPVGPVGSAARKFQRVLSAAGDSWYVVCCLEDIIP